MASTGGRILRITNGGSIVFEEANVTGTYTASIVTDNLTANRTIRIADADGIIQGLLPGEGWPTTKGGTGLTLVPANQIPIGTGTDVMALIPAPGFGVDNAVLNYDLTTNSFAWVPLDFSGLEVTTATNYLNDPTKPGIYSHKSGTQLVFKNLQAGTGILLLDMGDRINMAVDMATIQVTPTNFIGTLPVNKGGTGRTTLASNEIILGNTTGPVNSVTAPSSNGQVLVFKGGNIIWDTTPYLTESFSGDISYPENKDYYLSLKWNNVGRIRNIRYQTAGGNCNIDLKIGSTIISGATMVASGTPADRAMNQAISTTSVLILTVSGVLTTTSLRFAIDWERG